MKFGNIAIKILSKGRLFTLNIPVVAYVREYTVIAKFFTHSSDEVNIEGYEAELRTSNTFMHYQT